MLRFWREVLILVLAGTCYLLYSIRGGPDCPPVAPTVTEKVVIEQKVTTVTTKPDGTKIEKTVETEKKTKEKSKPSDKVVEAAAARQSKYDIHFTHDGKSFHSIGVGARLGDLPAFGTLDYEIPTRSVLIGVRAEF